MHSPPRWAAQVIAGFLILNIAGFATLAFLGLGSICADSGIVMGGKMAGTGVCEPQYAGAAIGVGLVGFPLGIFVVSWGLLINKDEPSKRIAKTGKNSDST